MNQNDDVAHVCELTETGRTEPTSQGNFIVSLVCKKCGSIKFEIRKIVK